MRKIKFVYCLCAVFIVFINTLVTASAATQTELGEQIKSETAVLIDGDTGQVLFEKDMNKIMYPASITKIMTALLAFEKGNLSDTITMSYDAVFSVGRDTSHIALDVDEELSLEQAMYALALESANDAANGIAEYIGGSMEDFAVLMNRRAKEAGALNTNFTNAHGLPDENHYTTAYDMARITMATIRLPEFVTIFTAEKYDMAPTNLQTEERHFWCRNAMMVGDYKYDGIIVEKTGWTDEAKHTLVTAAKRGDRTLIAVVMKSPNPSDKWKDATALLDYGFGEFKGVSFSAEELFQESYVITDASGVNTDVSLSSASGFDCLIPRALTKADVKIEYVLDNNGAYTDPRVQAAFSLKSSDINPIYAELGRIEMQAQLNDAAVSTYTDLLPEDTKQLVRKDQKWYSKLTWPLLILAFMAFTILLLRIRRYFVIKKRRERRARRYGRYRYYG